MLTTDVWGILFAIFIFNEGFRVLTFIGFFFVVSGMIVYNLAPNPFVGLENNDNNKNTAMVVVDDNNTSL